MPASAYPSMYCPNDGNPLDQLTGICTRCGREQPGIRKKAKAANPKTRTKRKAKAMKAEAKHGRVLVDGDSSLLSREEALELLASLANAIHMSGDISDPAGVRLSVAVRKAVEDFREEQ